MDKLTYDVKELSVVLGIGITKAYMLIKGGNIPFIRFDRKILIPKNELDYFLRTKSLENVVIK